MTKKRIIVIDDQPLISNLIKELVSDEQELEVVQITSKKEEFLDAAVHGHSFDVALIDISVGDREGGIEILKTLQARNILLPAIMLSAHDEVLYALKCLKAGARGYVNKECICDDLVRAVKEVLNSQLFVSGEKGKHILDEFKKSNERL